MSTMLDYDLPFYACSSVWEPNKMPTMLDLLHSPTLNPFAWETYKMPTMLDYNEDGIVKYEYENLTECLLC